MNTQELSVDTMLPHISQCRLFNTRTASDWAPIHRISEFYELSYYLEGSGVVTINDTTYPIHAGNIRFTKPGTALYGLPHYSCYTVYFDFGNPETVYYNPLLEGIPEYFHANGDIQTLFEELLSQFQSNRITAPIRQNALLLTLLSSLFETTHPNTESSPVVRSCIEYMETHYSQNITLELLGSLSGYSTLHILRLFKQDLGCTPHDYLTSLRINHAKRMLTDTHCPINTIAAECGFSSESHFKTLFKKITGLTPGAYRRSTGI